MKKSEILHMKSYIRDIKTSLRLVNSDKVCTISFENKYSIQDNSNKCKTNQFPRTFSATNSSTCN